jgi:hypothetical protein
MGLMEYDFLTRCRAIFTISLGILVPGMFSLDEDFFLNLHGFANNKILEDRKRVYEFALILPSKRINYTRQFYEDENTVGNLMKIMSEVQTVDQYNELLDTLEPRQVNTISNLVSEFIEYIDSFDQDYIHSIYPQ